MKILASLQKIDEIRPIEGAADVETVVVLGHLCVVRKGDLVVGDPCFYLEVGSFIPKRRTVKFLKRLSGEKVMVIDGVATKGYKVERVVIQGQISDGLVLPLSYFPEAEQLTAAHVGMDATRVMGVVEYQP